MAKDFPVDPNVWQEFQKAARQKRRDPSRLLTEYMRECMEIWEAQKLDEEIRRQARRSGYREQDAVDIVRRYRQAKRERGGAS